MEEHTATPRLTWLENPEIRPKIGPKNPGFGVAR